MDWIIQWIIMNDKKYNEDNLHQLQKYIMWLYDVGTGMFNSSL